MNLGIVGANHGQRVVNRIVVDHPHLQFQLRTVGQTSLRTIDRRQALLEEVLDVIVDYNYS